MEGARRLLAGAAIGVAATWAVATLVDRCLGKKDAEVRSHILLSPTGMAVLLPWPVLLEEQPCQGTMSLRPDWIRRPPRLPPASPWPRPRSFGDSGTRRPPRAVPPFLLVLHPVCESKSPKNLKDGVPLSEALTPEMEEAALLAWRKKYRGYRQGEERGAAGEATGLLKRGEKSQSHSNLSNLALSDFEQPPDDMDDSARGQPTGATGSPQDQGPDLGNVTFGFYDQRNGSWENLERADPACALTAYRRAYRAHRMGGANGAKGELSDLPPAVGSPRRRGRKGLVADDQEMATDHHPDSRQREEEAAYRAAVAADPTDNDAHYNLGALLSRRAVQIEKEGGDRYTVAELYEECAQLWGVSQGLESNEAKSAEVKAKRARAGQPLPTSDCCLGHGLVHGAAMDGWSCDACGSMLDTGMPASFCEPCGYVVCPQCRRRRSSRTNRGNAMTSGDEGVISF
mmetsp:Transcript_61529/g.169068  ORF Transcript_61529/g.169068 Transcript_61529/m.169068 type:complete len:457 (-) Transcript_61529:452-1822(-)